MSERYEHLILSLSSHSISAQCLHSYLRMLCAHTTYHAIFAATVPLRVLLPHTTIEHYFRMLVSQGIFACHVRTLASALFLFRRYCCALFKITRDMFACQFRTCSAYDMFAGNCRRLFLGCSCRMLLSHAISHVIFACYFRTLCSHAHSHITLQAIRSQANCARYLGTLGSHTIYTRYSSFANTLPTLSLEPSPHPLNASGGTGRRPLQ